MTGLRVDRRSFLAGAGAVAASAVADGAFSPSLAQQKPRVVVIGGGPGGATAAKYIAKGAGGAIDVTLVEPAREFTTCFFSNLYLGGLRDFSSITHGYEALAKAHGIRLVHQAASFIDRERKSVRLEDGTDLPYDRLVLSPGIDLKYESVRGYSQAAAEIMPHAWKAGPQTQLLKDQLAKVPDGGLVVVVAPPNPYRCPPGPYERVSMMAHVLKTSGRGRSRIIVLDPKDKFSKMGLFQEGWEAHYPGMVEWQDPNMHGGILGVDPATKTVKTQLETYKADLVNVIPAQAAGKIARDAGLANETGYCPVDPATMKAASDRDIHVLGDACIAGDMPKSGFAANSHAKVAAMVIRAELAHGRAFPARYASTCWSLITPEDCVKVGGSYAPAEGRIKEVEGFVSQLGESPELRKQSVQENLGWYAAMIADVFS